ncbi:hypothetical protein ACGFYP_22765 [Streptomyces sp. NPDC048370]|uniref:hypothetical protein n=1 Tax=Streptomyces sp. NPDC048370 TaxID=3365540 RepID=UPI003717C5AF
MSLDDGLRGEKCPRTGQLVKQRLLFGGIELAGRGAGVLDGEGMVIFKICHGVTTPN